MYTIVQASGKQFLFEPNKWYDLDVIKDGNPGDFIYFHKILLLKLLKKIQIGKPFLFKSKIVGQIIQNVKGKKITVLKTRPKKNYTRTKGHRQSYTRVKIISIS